MTLKLRWEMNEFVRFELMVCVNGCVKEPAEFSFIVAYTYVWDCLNVILCTLFTRL